MGVPEKSGRSAFNPFLAVVAVQNDFLFRTWIGANEHGWTELSRYQTEAPPCSLNPIT